MLSNHRVTAALPASDYERAKKFYEEILGLEPSERSGEGGTMYPCGEGTELFVYPSGFAGTNQATAASWQVTDLESVVDELRGRGVKFEDYDFPGLKTENGVAELEDGSKGAWFTDTEGNILSLNQLTG